MRTVAAMTILFLVACGGRESTETNSAAPAAATEVASAKALTPEQLGELGAQIRKEPERAQELLTAGGLDEKSFEQAIRDVTENPQASQRYAAAYRKASS
jgi:hypothetical protein